MRTRKHRSKVRAPISFMIRQDLVISVNARTLPLISQTEHLNKALWEFDAKYNGVDHFHWINNTGLLSVEDIEAIAREVW